MQMETEINNLSASELGDPMKDFERGKFDDNGVNTEGDEEKIGLILNGGTYVLQIKSLKKEIEAKDKEI